MMMGFGVLMMLLWLLVAAGVIAVVVWAIVHFVGGGGRPGAAGPVETPRQILDRRFASGEIDVEEYRRLRRELE